MTCSRKPIDFQLLYFELGGVSMDDEEPVEDDINDDDEAPGNNEQFEKPMNVHMYECSARR